VKHYSVCTSTGNFIAEKTPNFWYSYFVDKNLNLSMWTNILKTTFSVSQEAKFQHNILHILKIQINYIE